MHYLGDGIAGHVLISPQRVVARFSELSADEVADLWQLTQKVSACMEHVYKAQAASLVIQVCCTEMVISTKTSKVFAGFKSARDSKQVL
jgi:hypothetical protein